MYILFSGKGPTVKSERGGVSHGDIRADIQRKLNGGLQLSLQALFRPRRCRRAHPGDLFPGSKGLSQIPGRKLGSDLAYRHCKAHLLRPP